METLLEVTVVVASSRLAVIERMNYKRKGRLK
jgi:hypothetical protein